MLGKVVERCCMSFRSPPLPTQLPNKNVSYRSSFFPVDLWPLQYGPQTWLERGIDQLFD